MTFYIGMYEDGTAVQFGNLQYAIASGLPYAEIELDKIPEGSGKLKTDLVKLWWEQETISIDLLRATALQRISGKCSAAIASGIDYNGKHYSLTETKQGYINNAYLEVLGGATQVKLAADGEDVTWHTATQVTELFHKATGWGKICIYYKGYLSAWVDAETDTAVLDTIDYGTVLPAAYATSLTTKLSEEGIDITKYTAALTGG